MTGGRVPVEKHEAMVRAALQCRSGFRSTMILREVFDGTDKYFGQHWTLRHLPRVFAPCVPAGGAVRKSMMG